MDVSKKASVHLRSEVGISCLEVGPRCNKGLSTVQWRLSGDGGGGMMEDS